MNVFGIGLPEMAVIAAIGLLDFGPKRLPELGKTLGRTLKGFQTASQDFEKEFRTAIATSEATALEPTELKETAQVAPVLESAEASADSSTSSSTPGA